MVMPYLNFNGNCEEAFKLYEKAFGGKIEHMVKYGDSPEDPHAPLTPQQKNQVMHAQLKLTETGCISGADATWPIDKGSALHIHAHLPSEAIARSVFSALAEEGVVLGELAQNPPPDDDGLSGMVQDKFGFKWVLSAYKDSSQ